MLQFVRSKVLLGFVAGALTLGLVANDADARRMGGSRSIGKRLRKHRRRRSNPVRPRRRRRQGRKPNPAIAGSDR